LTGVALKGRWRNNHERGASLQRKRPAGIRAVAAYRRWQHWPSQKGADFLLAWHNAAENGGWDPVDLWSVDAAIADDILAVLHLIRASHCYPPELGFDPEITAVWEVWRNRMRQIRHVPCSDVSNFTGGSRSDCPHQLGLSSGNNGSLVVDGEGDTRRFEICRYGQMLPEQSTQPLYPVSLRAISRQQSAAKKTFSKSRSTLR
jgi:hypothetical protein